VAKQTTADESVKKAFRCRDPSSSIESHTSDTFAVVEHAGILLVTSSPMTMAAPSRRRIIAQA
jgi:hypothetical protein